MINALTASLVRHRAFLAAIALLSTATLALSGDGIAIPWAKQLENYLAASRSEHNHAIKQWREVAAWNFDDGKMPESFRVYDGKWEVADGKLRASDGKPDDNRTIKFAQCQWPAFRVEFDASLKARPGTPPERVCDIGVLLNADDATGHFRDGYAVLCGTYFNQATVLYRLYIPYARTEWSPLVPGKTHRVALEVVKPHIRFFVDGRIVLETWERGGKGGADASDWLDMDAKRVIALHTYDCTMEIDNLRVLVPDEGK